METNDHIQQGSALINKKNQQMKKLEVAAIITMILGIVSIIAVLFTYLALCDIGNHEPNLNLEWNIVGVGLMIWIAFIVSTLFTVTFLFRFLEQQSKSRQIQK